ncbi:MAG TPA: hypothetical protein VKZ78_08125 [Sphingobacteriaceae bacterium]|nr:hypothetical protein [Sphingobacteriaceae bacterium]
MGDAYHSLQAFVGANHRPDEIENIEERIGIVIHKLKFIPDSQRTKVTYLRETAPWQFARETYVDQAIRLAGGIPQTDPSQADFAPEVLIILSDKPVANLLGELPATLSSSFWPDTNAVKNNQVYLIHHPEYLRTPGLYPADDVEILAEIINSGYFVYGRNEDVWMQFDLG